MKSIAYSLALTALIVTSPAFALDIAVSGIDQGKRIPDDFAYCMKDGTGHTTKAKNINPAVSWSNVPAGTKSFALLVVDKDVPADFTNANKDGKTLPENAPRKDFYHWVLYDIPVTTSTISQGQDSTGTPEGGKKPGKTNYGINGQNDFATFMKGTFGGYDGPCPPWNDERIHNYHFRIYALDVDSLKLQGVPNGAQVEQAIEPHKLGMAEIVGTYSNKQ